MLEYMKMMFYDKILILLVKSVKSFKMIWNKIQAEKLLQKGNKLNVSGVSEDLSKENYT